jgi:hypothetical protein
MLCLYFRKDALQLNVYKYPLRDTYTSKKVTCQTNSEIFFASCSLGEKIEKETEAFGEGHFL